MKNLVKCIYFRAFQVNGRVISLYEIACVEIDYVIAALKQDPSTYKAMNSKLWNDLGVINLILEQDGLALKFVSEKFRNFKTVVIREVKENGLAIQYASSELRNDSEIREISKFVEEGIEFSFIPSGKIFDPLLKRYKKIEGFFISSHEIQSEIFERHLE